MERQVVSQRRSLFANSGPLCSETSIMRRKCANTGRRSETQGISKGGRSLQTARVCLSRVTATVTASFQTKLLCQVFLVPNKHYLFLPHITSCNVLHCVGRVTGVSRMIDEGNESLCNNGRSARLQRLMPAIIE